MSRRIMAMMVLPLYILLGFIYHSTKISIPYPKWFLMFMYRWGKWGAGD